MAAQQQKPAPAKANQGPLIFWSIVVIGLIITIGYFGFIDVGK